MLTLWGIDILSKKMCKRCHKEYFSNDRILWWCKEDEERWNNGTIICPHKHGYDDTEQGLPKDCPYLLEHLISQEN